MGKDRCIRCDKELGFMKYKPKKEWGLPEGSLCGDCYRQAEKQIAVVAATSGKSTKELSPQELENLRTEFKEASAVLDAGNVITKDVKEDAKEDRKIRDARLRIRTEEYKLHWEKNGIIQFKNERIAILKRQWGAQVEFIIAFDDLTNEGYELKAIDEGKTQEGTFGQSGGVSSYYYFQRRFGSVPTI